MYFQDTDILAWFQDIDILFRSTSWNTRMIGESLEIALEKQAINKEEGLNEV